MPLEIVPYHVILGFRYSIDEFFVLPGCYTAYCDSCLLTFQGSLLVPSSTRLLCFIHGDGTDRLSQNVSK